MDLDLGMGCLDVTLLNEIIRNDAHALVYVYLICPDMYLGIHRFFVRRGNTCKIYTQRSQYKEQEPPLSSPKKDKVASKTKNTNL